MNLFSSCVPENKLKLYNTCKCTQITPRMYSKAYAEMNSGMNERFDLKKI